ncbi:MAG TPA: serine/threonine-protein kinase [Gemmatimonadales bacterium]|nr:serine/threonine-protein kinase [Gemmatimonadales bacterium]
MKPELRSQIQAALADRYALDRELGRGGMASVVLARDLAAGRTVALKVLHAELASTVGADRFKREIRVAQRLQHPHILGILDSGETPEGQLWFTMPVVEGENLFERLQRESQLPADEAVRIGTAVAKALGYAHAQGVIHRDIKPENVLLSGDQVLVADFGVARAVSEMAEKLTATGMIVGTPTYMSPEQASGDKAIDGRSDIFALGCVIYEMLAGEPPFKGPNPQATLMRRFMGPPRPLRPVIELPEHVEAALLRALDKDPAARFATADQFADALAGRPPVPVALPEPVQADATAVAPGGKRGCAVVLLAGGLGLAGSLAVAGHLVRWS